MRLHTSGFKLPKLGSMHDRVLRKFLTKESEKETKKTQLLAQLAIQALPQEDTRVKKIWKEYLGLEYGITIPDERDHEVEMATYYNNVVKHLNPKLTMKDGQLTVLGLGRMKTETNTTKK